MNPIVEEIVRRGALPLEESLALPPDAYRSAEILELERERIFRREWLCVGRADEIPEPGDWFSAQVAGEPILVVRGADGRIRALANACRHRFAQLASGRGHAQRFTCPYHAWSYDLEGRLRGAPFMDRAAGFDVRDCRLPELRTESWAGFLYVNLDDGAEPLAPRLAPITELFAPYGLERMRTVVRGEEVWDANWKLVAENAMESYHVFQGHRETLDPIFPTARLEIQEGGAGYNLHSSPMREGATFPGTGDEAVALNPGLAPEQACTLWLACIYPAHIVVVAPATLLHLTAEPHGVDRTRISFAFSQLGPFPEAATPEGDAYRAAIAQSTEAVNAEDRALVAAVQRGLASSRAVSGRLSHLERPVWEFIRYLGTRLTA